MASGSGGYEDQIKSLDRMTVYQNQKTTRSIMDSEIDEIVRANPEDIAVFEDSDDEIND